MKRHVPSKSKRNGGSEYFEIRAHLRAIDQARNNLVGLQNSLSRLMCGLDPIARKIFSEFYCSGGVTAEDWEMYFRTRHRPVHKSIGDGRLRVVRRSSGVVDHQQQKTTQISKNLFPKPAA
jgi:hypothetical protein